MKAWMSPLMKRPKLLKSRRFVKIVRAILGYYNPNKSTQRLLKYTSNSNSNPKGISIPTKWREMSH
ncbi:hypothetical protein H5410_053044 [Solanum commersonii]|uniref:Uncharacterized protein n=1 Tax=Solanum commersonii TaxID=4109 RepID=A0A9J5X2F6_SOLCO|nr:hypothetical protein H5410_053044 [Solanum commersonii]